ncbi:PucR family transcriptional regulator [Corynebacterium sp.]|uniref:PucR family transcriptional regulator n=1 Tax=Corynebacterium sp. TaxID=1720 RepID=UPI0028A7B5B1|nr:PucR family transcriptional regulator [Corynebacterium sp.]
MLIADLIADPSLHLELATPSWDEELHRPVRAVATAEQMDPTAYLEPDTLLLTTGMAMNFEDGRIWEAYVERLVGAHVPAVAFGIGQPHRRVPAGLLAAARSVGLPVLTVSADMPFLHLQHSVNQAIAGEKYWLSRQAWDIATVCTGSASRNESFDQLVQLIEMKAGTSLTVFDETGFPLAGSLARGPGEGGNKLSIPLSISGETTWTLVVPDEPGRDMRVLLTPAAAILGMALTREVEDQGAAVATRTAEMIALPDSGLVPFVLSELLEAGVDPARGIRGARIASRSGVRRSVLARRVASVLSPEDRSVLPVTVGSFLLIVMPDDGHSPQRCLPDVLNTLVVDREAGDSVLVGPVCSTPEELVLSLRMQVGREVDPGVTVQDGPGLEDIVGLLPEVFRTPLISAVLGPLLETSDQRRSVATLEALLRSETQRGAAEALGVHRNTLLASRRRVERKLGQDLADPENRALCVMALRLLEMSGE